MNKPTARLTRQKIDQYTWSSIIRAENCKGLCLNDLHYAWVKKGFMFANDNFDYHITEQSSMYIIFDRQRFVE